LIRLQKAQIILAIAISIKNYAQNQANNIVELAKYSVSLSKDKTTLALGAHDVSGNYSKSGRVRVYKNNSGFWEQIGSDINGEAKDDWSGYSVSLSANGTIVAIGAKYNHGINGVRSGHVRVYKYNSGMWKQIGNDIDGEAEGDWSGYSVSLSDDGTTVAIGAILNEYNGKDSGHVRIYENKAGVWNQIGEDINGKATRDYFGSSVSLSGNGKIVAIGAHQGGGSSGYVSVYKNVFGEWQQIGGDVFGEPVSNNFFGWNVSMSGSGNTVAIGGYKNNNKGLRCRYVRVFQNQSNTWVQKGTDIGGELYDDLLFNNLSFGNNRNNAIAFLGVHEDSVSKIPSIVYNHVYTYNLGDDIWEVDIEM